MTLFIYFCTPNQQEKERKEEKKDRNLRLKAHASRDLPALADLFSSPIP